MIFQPVIPLVPLAVFALAAIIFCVFVAIKSTGQTRWAWFTRIFAVILMLLMCLRPGIGELQEVNVYANQYDVYFVVDTTSSMAAEDWDEDGATRLSGVKKDINRLVDEYSGAKFSLITFDSAAIVRTPLTKDATALMTSIQNLSLEITKNSQGSSPWEASDVLTRTLQANIQTNPDRLKLVFVFTDGEKTSEKNPTPYSSASTMVSGGAIYGYGTVAGGQMKKQNGYYITANDGEYIMDTTKEVETEAVSKIDEENLNKISEELKVDYFFRNSDTPVPLIDVNDSELTENTSVSMNVTTDYTWLVAMLLGGLIASELAFSVIALSFTRKREKQNV